MINRLQNYYGIALRATCKTSVPTMRNAVGTGLFHCSEAIDSAGMHQFCPKSSISWCKSQVDQVNSTSDYIEEPGLPIPLRKKLEPIFRELSSPELLAKSIHGQTQNNNESIMGIFGSVARKIPLLIEMLLKCLYHLLLLVLIQVSVDYLMSTIVATWKLVHIQNCFCYLDDCRQNKKSSAATKKRRKTIYDQLPKDTLTMKLRMNLVTPVVRSLFN